MTDYTAAWLVWGAMGHEEEPADAAEARETIEYLRKLGREPQTPEWRRKTSRAALFCFLREQKEHDQAVQNQSRAPVPEPSPRT